MALEFETQEAVPEAIRADFVEIGGKWVPKGYIPEAAHEDMKSRHAKQAERLKSLEEQAKGWDGIDPAQAREAQAELKRLREEATREKTGKTSKELDAIVEERYGVTLKDRDTLIESLRGDLEKRAGEIAQRDELINQRFIDIEVGSAAAALKDFRHDIPSLITDAQRVARDRFKVEDGVPIARDKEGGVMRGKDHKPLTILEWLAGTKEDRPHWWRPSGSGGGAGAGGAGGGGRAITRDAFRELGTQEKADFMKNGGRLIDAA
jgi:hypothetical protein